MRVLRLTSIVAAAIALAGCRPAEQPAASTDHPGPLVVYSGRSEALVEPMLDRFREHTGIAVEARYGTDAELLAALREEGAASPADVYWANTTGALIEAESAGLLAVLADSLRRRPSAFAPATGRWVPATVRFRVLAYSPARVDSASLPGSVLDLPRRASLRGRVGWTPTYSSFQDFITALRELRGDEAARNWIEGMMALEPKSYPSNTPMLEALVAGEIDVALTNHYYVFRILNGGAPGGSTQSAGPPVAIHHFAAGDPGNLALVTGAGQLTTSGRPVAAQRFLAFLLSDAAQSMAAQTVHEYPVVGSARLPAYLMSFDRAMALGPTIDPARLTDLEGTLRMLREADLL